MAPSAAIRMLRTVLLVPVVMAIAACGGATDKPAGQYTEAISRQAAAVGKALKDQDYKTFVDAMHPKMIELAGGKEQLMATVTASMEKMRGSGLTFDSIAMGAPSEVVQEGEELQCTVTQRVVMTGPKGKYRMQSTLLGVSDDKGKTWYFLDSEGMSESDFHEVLPHVSSKLVIAAPEKPHLIEPGQ